jgi:hypothetical protein
VYSAEQKDSNRNEGFETSVQQPPPLSPVLTSFCYAKNEHLKTLSMSLSCRGDFSWTLDLLDLKFEPKGLLYASKLLRLQLFS